MPVELPEPEGLQLLDAEEIGYLILCWLKENPNRLHRSGRVEDDPTISFSNIVQMYRTDMPDRALRENVQNMLMEGWQWLERTGLICEDPRQNNPVFKIISWRGNSINTEEEFFDFQSSQLLPESIIHPKLLLSARGHFLRKEYDTAIFAAFRQVEIEVREAFGYDNSVIGVDLMRRAFNKDNGPLSDRSLLDAERTHIANLFAGAMGAFKNPSSHRTVAFNADESLELLFLASRFLKIIDQRRIAMGSANN